MREIWYEREASNQIDALRHSAKGEHETTRVISKFPHTVMTLTLHKSQVHCPGVMQ